MIIDEHPHYCVEWDIVDTGARRKRFRRMPVKSIDDMPGLCWISDELYEYIEEFKTLPIAVLIEDYLACGRLVQRLDAHPCAYHRMVADYWKIYGYLLPRIRTTLAVWGILDIPVGSW